jgi:hypothetical protein
MEELAFGILRGSIGKRGESDFVQPVIIANGLTLCSS